MPSFRSFLVFLFIVLSHCGLRQFILRHIAFQPPKRPTYTFRKKNLLRKSAIERAKTPSSSNSKNRIHRISSWITQKDVRPYKTSTIAQDEQVTYYNKDKQSVDEEIQNSSVNQSLYPEHELKLISPKGELFEMNRLEDLQLSCYYVRSKRSENIIPIIFVSPLESDFVIIYSHPNAADLGLMLDNYLDLAYNLKINIVGYDYSGYGQSSGVPSDLNAIGDLQAVYDFTLRELGFSWDKVILYGQSIGSGPSVTLASDQRYPIAGLIIHSGLSSGLRVVDPSIRKTHFYDMFPNIDLLPYVNCLVYILHGEQDHQIDVSSVRSMTKYPQGGEVSGAGAQSVQHLVRAGGRPQQHRVRAEVPLRVLPQAPQVLPRDLEATALLHQGRARQVQPGRQVGLGPPLQGPPPVLLRSLALQDAPLPVLPPWPSSHQARLRLQPF